MAKKRPKGTGDSVDHGKKRKANGNSANVGFEAQLFLAADKLRKNLEPSDYKHVALGLIFLKYISIAFAARRAVLLSENAGSAEDRDERIPRRERVSGARNVLQQAEALSADWA